MILLRKADERGGADHGWLKTRHTFSFADYYDDKFMGFGSLRVINEDRIEGDTGFGAHAHRNMEIISYVIDGALVHEDSIGNRAVILPGEVQRMSAGRGIRHAEHNHLRDKTTHFLQIWILPEREELEPGYGQRSFAQPLEAGEPVLVVSREGREGSVSIHQDVDIYAVKTAVRGQNTRTAHLDRHYWLQVIRGDVTINGTELSGGDGAGVTKIDVVHLEWAAGSEFLFFDMK